MADQVRYQVDGAVGTVTLHRPDALNALTGAMKGELLGVLRQAAADQGVRAVVLTGAGRAFCVGQDLREHAEALRTGAALDTVRDHYNPIVTVLAGMPKPVVAAVGGPAAGAGAALAFACDFRIASPAASFSMAFSRIALSADSGASWTLPRLVGHARALRMLALAEPLSAEQAESWGAVDEIVPADQLTARAAEFAGQLAAGPTTAYAAIKEALNFAAGHPLEEALEVEAVLQNRCGATADHAAATEAFLAKAPVTFTGR